MSAKIANLARQANCLGGAPLDGVDAADLRVVSMDWIDGRTTEHIVIAEQLSQFVEACKRLPFDPGVNPHNGAETARIWRLRAAELRAYGPYWWAQPKLGVSPSDGAFTIRGGVGQTIWRDENHEVES